MAAIDAVIDHGEVDQALILRADRLDAGDELHHVRDLTLEWP